MVIARVASTKGGFAVMMFPFCESGSAEELARGCFQDILLGSLGAFHSFEHYINASAATLMILKLLKLNYHWV